MRSTVGAVAVGSVLDGPVAMATPILLAPQVALHEPQVDVQPILPPPSKMIRIARVPEAQRAEEVLPRDRLVQGRSDDLARCEAWVPMQPGPRVGGDGHGKDLPLGAHGNPDLLSRIAREVRRWRRKAQVK